MSKESAQKFVERINSDEAFRNSLVAADSDAARAKIAKDAGYDFTREEVEPLLPAAADGDLSDEDLEAVSGGSDGKGVSAVVSAVTAAAAVAAA